MITRCFNVSVRSVFKMRKMCQQLQRHPSIKHEMSAFLNGSCLAPTVSQVRMYDVGYRGGIDRYNDRHQTNNRGRYNDRPRYNDRFGDDIFGDRPPKEDYYPDHLATHDAGTSQRVNNDWSKLQPSKSKLERKLFPPRDSTGNNFESIDVPVETSGKDAPAPISTFEDAGLGEILDNNLNLMGIKQATPVQKYSTSIVMGGSDLMTCSQTGSGKTIAYLTPILANLFKNGPPEELKKNHFGGVTPLAVIMTPTRELASQTFQTAQQLCYRSSVRPYVVYGGANINTQIGGLSMGAEVLVATPGRLIDLLNRGEISMEFVKYLILDEADRMLDMGFEKDIRCIVGDYNMPAPGKRQTLMYSATFPKAIQMLAKQFMTDYTFLTVGRIGSTTNSITQNILDVRSAVNKTRTLLTLLNEDEGRETRTLVFASTKNQCKMLTEQLEDTGSRAVCIHGDKTQSQREKALNQFRSGRSNILIATDVAARGLDVPEITHVINYDLPNCIDDYVHRIGRTGRMGKPGKATSFVNPFDRRNQHLLSSLVNILEENKQNVPDFLEKSRGRSEMGRSSYSSRNQFGARDYRRSSEPSQQRWGSNIGSSQGQRSDRRGSLDRSHSTSNFGRGRDSSSTFTTTPPNRDTSRRGSLDESFSRDEDEDYEWYDESDKW